MSTKLKQLQQRLRQIGDPDTAKNLQRFFKTGRGGYGEGDRFLGVRVPALRKLVRELHPVPLDEIAELIGSPYHEERLLALLLLVRAYERGDELQREHIYRLYLNHTAGINNWDLVDASAEHIVGAHLQGRSRRPLQGLARSASVWERRIAVLATYHFIKRGEFEPTLELARVLLNDSQDLFHKAVGWMLREVSKRDESAARVYLDEHGHRMPRTMLRYAIERFAEPVRQRYLKA